MEEVVEIKNTTRKIVSRVRIPGYVLVRMDLDDASWGVVRHTPGVTGFVGNDAHHPQPLSLDEVYDMLAPSVIQEAARAAEKAGLAVPASAESGARPPPPRSTWTSRSASRSPSTTARSRPSRPRSPRSSRRPSSSWCSSRSSSAETPVTLSFNQVTKAI